jgi:hypothetical protein
MVDWGDVPTWVGGAGALAAGWFAYQTIKSQREQIGEQRDFIREQSSFMDEQRQNLELERAELHAAAEERRWAQARKVKMESRQIPTSTGGIAQWAVEVRNDSDATIREVQVRFGTDYVAHEVYVALGSHALGLRLSSPALVGAGKAVEFRSPSWQESTVHNNRPTVYFTDNDGVRWSHDWLGDLKELPAGEEP